VAGELGKLPVGVLPFELGTDSKYSEMAEFPAGFRPRGLAAADTGSATHTAAQLTNANSFTD
jgi:hypothetical protein